MNVEQVTGLARQLAPFVGGILVAKGFLSNEQIGDFVQSAPQVIGAIGALLTGISSIWSLFKHSQAQQIATVQRLVSKNGLSVQTQAAILDAAAPLTTKIEAKNDAVAHAAGPKVVPSETNVPLNTQETIATVEENTK